MAEPKRTQAMQIHQPIAALTPRALLDAAVETPVSTDLLYGLAIAAGSVYLAATAYSSWRRKSLNLTPVTSAAADPAARPDFLNVDKDARSAALERGDAFEASLRAREASAAADGAPETAKKFSLVAMVMSAFTLVTMLVGSVWQISFIGRYAEQLSAKGRLVAMVKEHPLAFSVSMVVCAVQVVTFFAERRRSA